MYLSRKEEKKARIEAELEETVSNSQKSIIETVTVIYAQHAYLG